MATTIGQVADKAGVSKATVSRVLNNSKPVNEETREKVLGAIKELDFKPNPAARSLVFKKSKTLGVVVTDISNLFVSVLVKGIEEYASGKGYNIIVCSSLGITEKEIELLMMLKTKRVDGIIFLTAQLMEKHRSFFKSFTLPLALVNVSYDKENIIDVCVDNRQAAYDMTSYFLKKGHTRIAMIRASLDDQYTGKERYLGYCQALEDYNVPFDEKLVQTGLLEAADGYAIVKKMIQDKTDLQSLFVACDLMSFGAIKALIDHGVRVPESVEVAGFDDVPMASFYNPAVTTVRQPIGEMGRAASELLIKRIEGETIKQWKLVLPHEIVFRDSTA